MVLLEVLPLTMDTISKNYYQLTDLLGDWPNTEHEEQDYLLI